MFANGRTVCACECSRESVRGVTRVEIFERAFQERKQHSARTPFIQATAREHLRCDVEERGHVAGGHHRRRMIERLVFCLNRKTLRAECTHERACDALCRALAFDAEEGRTKMLRALNRIAHGDEWMQRADGVAHIAQIV